MCHHQQLTSSVTSTHFSPKHVFSLLVCSYGTQSGQTVISRWCTAPACGSSTGAIPSSHSSMLTTPCCSCLASTSAHTIHHPGKSPSSAWVRTKTKAPKPPTKHLCVIISCDCGLKIILVFTMIYSCLV